MDVVVELFLRFQKIFYADEASEDGGRADASHDSHNLIPSH